MTYRKGNMNTKHATYLAKPVQLRLKPELHEWVHAQAQAQERSANWIINKVLEDACARAKHANLVALQPQGAQQ